MELEKHRPVELEKLQPVPSSSPGNLNPTCVNPSCVRQPLPLPHPHTEYSIFQNGSFDAQAKKLRSFLSYNLIFAPTPTLVHHLEGVGIIHAVTGGVWRAVCQQGLSAGPQVWIWEELGVMETPRDGLATSARLGQILPFSPWLWSPVFPGRNPRSCCPKAESERLRVLGASTAPISSPGTDPMAVRNSELLRPPEVGTGSQVTFLSPRAVPQCPLSSLETPKSDLSPAEPTSKEPGR